MAKHKIISFLLNTRTKQFINAGDQEKFLNSTTCIQWVQVQTFFHRCNQGCGVGGQMSHSDYNSDLSKNL